MRRPLHFVRKAASESGPDGSGRVRIVPDVSGRCQFRSKAGVTDDWRRQRDSIGQLQRPRAKGVTVWSRLGPEGSGWSRFGPEGSIKSVQITDPSGPIRTKFDRFTGNPELRVFQVSA